MFKCFLLPVALLFSASLYAQSHINQSTTPAGDVSLRNQIQQIAQTAQGRVGVAAIKIETGQSIELRGDEQFPMQSVYKFPIGMTTLHLVDQGKLKLDQAVHVDPAEYVSARQHSPLRDKNPKGADVTVGELLQYAVSESDGSASDVLMRLVGGPKVIMDYLRSFGVIGIVVANTEKEIGSDNAVQYRNWAKPNEIVELLKAVQDGLGLSASSRALLLRLMTDTETGLHRLKGQLPAGTVVAHKTGTSWTIGGVTTATNDVGLVTLPNGQHMAIAVFVSDAKADSDTREAAIARITKAIWDTWK
ncbi:class A beta-lactamase [Spirosoma jeollabukense]